MAAKSPKKAGQAIKPAESEKQASIVALVWQA
jgi:hypothetical protein